MTTETHLVTELGTLSVRTQGPATAGIWLITDNFAFPGVGWNDFIVVVLSWWVAAILDLLHNDNSRKRVHFMDGPYAVELSLTPAGRLQLRQFVGASGGCEVAVGHADVRRFVDELSTQSRQVLEECRLRGWWSLDAEGLTSHLKELDRVLALRGEAIS
jgi:hypothetical protein